VKKRIAPEKLGGFFACLGLASPVLA